MYGEHLNWFQRFLQRFQPTPIDVVKAELKDAELSAIMSESQAEFAALSVEIHKLTTVYHKNRAARLRDFVFTHDNGTETKNTNPVDFTVLG